MNDIEQQIAEKQEQSKELEKIWLTEESRTYYEGYLWGKIDLLSEQIAELRRKQDKRK